MLWVYCRWIVFVVCMDCVSVSNLENVTAQSTENTVSALYSRQDWFKEGNSRGVDWHGTLKYHSITNNSFNLCMTQWIVIKHACITLNLFFIHDWGYCSTSDLYDPADYDLQSRNVWLKRAIGSFNERNRRKKVSREMANPWLIHPLPGICSNILENVETSFLAC